QLDLNYTQHFPLPRGINLQLSAAVFNATNSQTGYNYETRIGTLKFVNVTTDTTTRTVSIPDSISDAALKKLVDPTNPDFKRSDWAVRAPTPNTFYPPRRYQITARIQF